MGQTIITDMPLLDLRHIPVEAFAALASIDNVKTILLDRSNAEAVMRVSRSNVRSHVIIEDNEIVLTGQVRFTDSYLSVLPDDICLVVVGHLIVSQLDVRLLCTKIRTMRVFGQILYSHPNTMGLLLSRLERLQGQIVNVPEGAIYWIGATLLDQRRLNSVSRRSVVSIGPITIDNMVDVHSITSAITSIVQIGELRGREDLVCALLSVCSRRLGSCIITPPAPTSQGSALQII